MRRFLLVPAVAALLLASTGASAQAFTSSNLPIVLIDTGGQTIPDEPKIPGQMAVIDNGPGLRNAVTDAPSGYVGAIGIEVRGSSSQSFPKKQWSVETRDAAGADLDVPLLGLPAESDWILYAPYSDKSLMRNVLAFHIARATGRYASRTRYCEVILNGQYQGIYVLEEKVKRDDNRVAINKLKPDEVAGDDLTGGYILQIDRGNEGAGGSWTSPFPSSGGDPVFFEYDDPDGTDLVAVQKTYIRGVVTGFETLMNGPGYADPQTGYAAALDVGSFVDFILVNELAKNVDGYRLSTYLYKDKDSVDPRLHAGPVWDFNLGFGNADYDGGAITTAFQIDRPGGTPFWWRKLANEPAFRDSMRTRWTALRRGALHPDSLDAFISATAATLGEAQARNFVRWPILGVYVWPNAYVGQTYADEVAYLRQWTRTRAAWLDGALLIPVGIEDDAPLAAGRLSAPVPNPSHAGSRVSISVASPQHVRVVVVDALGRRVAEVFAGTVAPGAPREMAVPTARLPAGVYAVRAEGETFAAVQRLTVVR